MLNKYEYKRARGTKYQVRRKFIKIGFIDSKTNSKL